MVRGWLCNQRRSSSVVVHQGVIAAATVLPSFHVYVQNRASKSGVTYLLTSLLGWFATDKNPASNHSFQPRALPASPWATAAAGDDDPPRRRATNLSLVHPCPCFVLRNAERALSNSVLFHSFVLKFRERKEIFFRCLRRSSLTHSVSRDLDGKRRTNRSESNPSIHPSFDRNLTRNQANYKEEVPLFHLSPHILKDGRAAVGR